MNLARWWRRMMLLGEEVNMPPKSEPKTVNKSAKNGQFVTEKQLKSSPSTTYKQTVKPSKK